jgi:hypothetical protein
LVGVVVSLALFAMFLRAAGVFDSAGEVVGAIGGSNPVWLVLSIGVYFAAVWVRAMRWNRLVLPFADVGTVRLYAILLIGFAVNNVLPFRLGEIVRAYLLRRGHGVPMISSLASIVVERALDLAALVVLVAAASLMAPMEGWLAAVAAFGWLGTICAGVGLAALLLVPRATMDWMLDGVQRIAARASPRLGELARSVILGLSGLRDRRGLVVIVTLSIGCWVVELGLYVCVMLALGFNSGLASMIIGMVTANLATALPSTPGYVGTFDAPLHFTLAGGFGVDDALAGSFTLLAHALLLVPVVIVGLLLLSREDLSWGALSRGRIEARASESAGP